MNAIVKFDFVANKNAENGERTITTIDLGEITPDQLSAIAGALTGLNNLNANRRKGYPRTFEVAITEEGIEVWGKTTCTRSADAPARKTKAVNPFLE